MAGGGERTLDDQYRSLFIQFMNFKDGITYERDHPFSVAELSTITSTEIARWMYNKAYGTPNPSPTDNPTECRASTLEQGKKAISHYLPNRHMQWNQLTTSGNPTKSPEVNEVISRVKTKEVRNQGKASQAREPFTEAEYECAISVMDSHEDVAVRLLVSTIFRFQYNMMARIDDSSKFLSTDLKESQDHPDYGLLAKICWSKNVREERQAPFHLILGAMNAAYCAIHALATWLEYFIGVGGMENTQFAFGINGLTDPGRIKSRASGFLTKRILDREEMFRAVRAKKGTHSIRKYSTTRARNSGCSKDECEVRGQWRRRRQQDVYTDVCLPWPDAKVAKSVCKGGPIHYFVKESSGMSEEWILENVVPQISSKYSRSAALVLGRGLLWRIFDTEQCNAVPVDISTRVKNARNNLGDRCQLLEGENPVQKVPITVTGHDAVVYIDMLLEDDGNGNAVPVAGQQEPRRIDTEQLRHMNTLLLNLRRDIADVRTDVTRVYERGERNFNVVNRNVRHFMRNPLLSMGVPAQVNREREGNIIAQVDEEEARMMDEERRNATLSTCPRTLHMLWNEYEFGLGNRKAAKDFTATERGKVKHKYSKRKVFWDKVAEMVRSGWSAQDACNRIYEVYGANETVTSIISRMQRDKRNGGNPALRVVN
jgi:hypothetical protein